MLVHNLVVTGSLTFPTALPISGSLLVSGSVGINTTAPVYALDVTGTGRFTSNIEINSSAANLVALTMSANSTGGVRQRFLNQAASTLYNFQIGSNITTNNAFEIIPSTAADGTTFSTAVFKILNTGAATFSSTIQSGNISIPASTGESSVYMSNASADLAIAAYSSSYGAVANYAGKSVIQAGSGGSGTSQLLLASWETSGIMTFYTGGRTSGFERMRITSSGSVGIGTTTPKTYSTLTNSGQLINLNNIGIDVGQSYRFNNYYNSGTGTDRTISTGYAGSIGFDNSGAGFTYNISSTSITADNNVTTSEKMRFSSKGYLKVTSTGTYNDTGADNHEFINGTINNNSFFVANTNTSYAGATLVRINCNRTTTNASYNLIGATNGNSTGEFLVRDSGNVQNTNNSYTGTSDIKLKQDIIDASSQWEDIKQMRIRKFRFKKQVEQDENAPYLLGVIAQELELISPNLVDEALDFDGTDEEVTTTTKSVKYSIIYMKAVKALQEAMAKIETLETTIDTLTSRITALEN